MRHDESQSLPTKRRHVSSLSKAMLAKKILSKIEEENDPSANVIPKSSNAADSSNEESRDQTSNLENSIPPQSLSLIPDT